MQIENLRDFDVQELESKLGELKIENPSITHTVYSMEDTVQPDSIDMITRVKNIEKSVEIIELMLRNIFGNSILIDGNFVEIKIGD